MFGFKESALSINRSENSLLKNCARGVSWPQVEDSQLCHHCSLSPSRFQVKEWLLTLTHAAGTMGHHDMILIKPTERERDNIFSSQN